MWATTPGPEHFFVVDKAGRGTDKGSMFWAHHSESIDTFRGQRQREAGTPLACVLLLHLFSFYSSAECLLIMFHMIILYLLFFYRRKGKAHSLFSWITWGDFHWGLDCFHVTVLSASQHHLGNRMHSFERVSDLRRSFSRFPTNNRLHTKCHARSCEEHSTDSLLPPHI